MHPIHHTEGIILGSSNFGEAGKYYSIFTRDLGMIYASAQGVRKMSSKLRFVLQDYAYVKIDLVQGRDFWRVTNVAKTGLLENIIKKPGNFAVLVNIARLLKRLLAGVEPNIVLFQELLNGFTILEKAETSEELRNIETIIVLRILNNLGYIGAGDAVDTLIQSPFEENLVFEASKERTKILKAINKALKETHL
ncbi:MAG TPA: recombination protein O N-terminal domain-containing protein [Candidatus Paceibacterota bacterium]